MMGLTLQEDRTGNQGVHLAQCTGSLTLQFLKNFEGGVDGLLGGVKQPESTKSRDFSRVAACGAATFFTIGSASQVDRSTSFNWLVDF